MKPARIILFILISTSVHAQFLEQKLLKVNGLSFVSGQDQIIAAFGQPDQTYEPNYDCGFLSSEEQGKTFYSLVYSGLKFTGNKSDNYLIEEVDLRKNSSLKIRYKDHNLNSVSSAKELAEILGIKPNSEYETNTTLKVFFQNSDDAIFFLFKNGKLVKLDYWSPC